MKNTIIEIIKELSGCDTVATTDSLQNNLGFDSLKMVTLLVILEEELNIELKESDMNPYELVTVADVLRLAERYGAFAYEED